MATYSATVIVDPPEPGGEAVLIIEGRKFVLRGPILRGLRELSEAKRGSPMLASVTTDGVTAEMSGEDWRKIQIRIAELEAALRPFARFPITTDGTGRVTMRLNTDDIARAVKALQPHAR